MRLCLSLVVAAVLGCILASDVQASLNYSTPGSFVSENFNGLASNPTAAAVTNIAWTDDVTIDGWYSNRTSYNAGIGSVNTGALYSFGSTASSDRALGSVASGGTGTITFGIKLINTTGITLNSFSIEYIGEQWRDGGNTTQQSLTVDYQIAGGSFVPASTLDFLGPKATATAAALDGNNAANKVAISSTLSGITWNPGDELFLRWTDLNHDGNDHGLAIDDFKFSANLVAGVVPEPASMLVWGGIGLLGTGLAVYKKKAA